MSVQEPAEGSRVEFENGSIKIPDKVQIPFIEGDGIGADITRAAHKVINAAVEKAYNGEKQIVWFEIFAGEKANDIYGEYMPKETLKMIEKYKVSIKGPLTTPVGGGMRSLNVFLRQHFDLYACVRPVRYYKGVPSPVKNPEKLNIVIFRENTEDVYAGIEWEKGSAEARDVIGFIKEKFNIFIREDSGIGIKPISETGTQRLVQMAIEYAIRNKRNKVTLVHKGNIMKYTEGAFKNWGYELASAKFSDKVISEDEVYQKFDGKIPEGKILINDRIADSMFQQVLTRPDEYDVIATSNLNGDYLSDACAAQVGGLGMAPGANIGKEIALFEATHGTAPKYKDMDKVNPSSLILSARMMLDHLQWHEPAGLVEKGLQQAISNKVVTYDLARLMENAAEVKCSEFADEIIRNL